MALRRKTTPPSSPGTAGGSAGRGGRSRATPTPAAAPARRGLRRARAARAGREPGSPGRVAQIRTVFSLTRKRDPRIVPLLAGAFLLPVLVGVLLGLLLHPVWLWVPLGVLVGLVLGLQVFSRRVQRSAFAEIEGKPGAAAGVVDRMRGDWRLTPAVQVNRAQDVVHRVVGRPGVILIAEGRGRGPRELLGTEVRRVRKVVGDTPIHDIVVGRGEGEVPLDRLQVTIVKLPRVIKGAQVDAVQRRLAALTATMPIPKGPVPTRVPRGGKTR